MRLVLEFDPFAAALNEQEFQTAASRYKRYQIDETRHSHDTDAS
jgi:hypothetical protein